MLGHDEAATSAFSTALLDDPLASDQAIYAALAAPRAYKASDATQTRLITRSASQDVPTADQNLVVPSPWLAENNIELLEVTMEQGKRFSTARLAVARSIR